MTKTQGAPRAPLVDDALREAFEAVERQPVPENLLDHVEALTAQQPASAAA